MSNDQQAKNKVAVVMGSQSDWPVIQEAVKTLKDFGVETEVKVLSAHRTPDEAAAYARSAAGNVSVIIAAAGRAAHLAGVLAAHTTIPVIGVPMKGGALDGLDALLATVQMPSGVPVATVALGKAGAVNAALLAVQILALSDGALAGKLQEHKATLKQKISKANEDIQSELKG